jgi:hypothetical protein
MWTRWQAGGIRTSVLHYTVLCCTSLRYVTRNLHSKCEKKSNGKNRTETVGQLGAVEEALKDGC